MFWTALCQQIWQLGLNGQISWKNIAYSDQQQEEMKNLDSSISDKVIDFLMKNL